MAVTPPAETLLGDLHERADGGFDGWCWAPGRPQERLLVDLLVNDTPAVSMVAALFRRDLLALGCGDGRHGFSLRLPPHLAAAGEECLITARERSSRRVFGRVLRAGPGRTPPAMRRVAAASETVAALWQETAALYAATSAAPATTRMRAALGQLAAGLAARAVGRRTPWRGAELAVQPAPLLTLVLRAGTRAATLRRIAALAPALATAAAELLVVDAADDPDAALLPAAVRHLRYLRDPAAHSPGGALRLAAEAARGRTLVLLDTAPGEPSAAALLALARGIAATPTALLLAAAVAEAAASLAPAALPDVLRLPAPLGLLLGGERALWRMLGADAPALQADTVLACADLALRARLLGHPWRCVREPAPIAPSRAASPLAAVRLIHERWGFGA